MSNAIYHINKGINQSIEFKGLKAQYIWYLGGGVVLLMITFSILYILGLPSIVCVGIIGVSGVVLVMKIYKMSHKYGEHGLMKVLSNKRIPKAIRSYNRTIFMMIR